VSIPARRNRGGGSFLNGRGRKISVPREKVNSTEKKKVRLGGLKKKRPWNTPGKKKTGALSEFDR